MLVQVCDCFGMEETHYAKHERNYGTWKYEIKEAVCGTRSGKDGWTIVDDNEPLDCFLCLIYQKAYKEKVMAYRLAEAELDRFIEKNN